MSQTKTIVEIFTQLLAGVGVEVAMDEYIGEICKFDIAGEMEILPFAIRAAMVWHRKVVAWTVDDDGALVLYWHAVADTNKLMVDAGPEATILMVREWLETNSEYGPPPQTDGSIGRGFRIHNDRWGHVDNNHYATMKVEPHWVVYGK